MFIKKYFTFSYNTFSCDMKSQMAYVFKTNNKFPTEKIYKQKINDTNYKTINNCIYAI